MTLIINNDKIPSPPSPPRHTIDDMTDTHILIVEDDAEISRSLATFLQAKGYTATTSDSAEAGLLFLKTHAPDLILLDLMLPGESGLDFCRKIRSPDSPPIIMVTALDDPIDNVVGLELGADDYVIKPFDLNVLLARIRAVLRRTSAIETAQKPVGEAVLQFSGFTFYPSRRFLRSPTGIRKPLTGVETDLLLVLCQHVKKVLSREDLIQLTRGSEAPLSMRSIDLLISRLRRKLVTDDTNEEFIRTFRNNGYMFRPDVRRV